MFTMLLYPNEPTTIEPSREVAPQPDFRHPPPLGRGGMAGRVGAGALGVSPSTRSECASEGREARCAAGHHPQQPDHLLPGAGRTGGARV